MTIRTTIQPTPTFAPAVWRVSARFLRRLINHWVASLIAHHEREAALIALRQLNDRELKDIGIYRCQIGDALTEIARERNRLQQCRHS